MIHLSTRGLHFVLLGCTLALVSIVVSGVAIANVSSNLMGTETIGNAPIAGANYKEWPKLMPVINNPSRVYHTWVNGDERFYYQASVEQVNQLLTDFSNLTSKKKEVLILPQREDVSTFDKSKSFPFNCQMQLVGGIAKATMTMKTKGDVFWPNAPRLTIHVAPGLDLKAIKVPAECTLVSLAQLKDRYNDGLKSDDKNVAGWGIGFLAQLDPYDAESLKTVAEIARGNAQGEDDWIALNAIANISSFGPNAKAHLPALKKIVQGDVKNNAQRAARAIEEIESVCEADAAAEFAKKEERFQDQAEAAQAFIDSRKSL